MFTSGALRVLFIRIAKDNNLLFAEEDTPDLDTLITDEFPIIQSGENTGVFLQRVASEYGYTLTTTNGKLHVRPADFRESLGVIILKYNSADANVASVVAKFKKPSVSYVPLTDTLQSPFKIEDTIKLPNLPFSSAIDFSFENQEKQIREIESTFDKLFSAATVTLTGTGQDVKLAKQVEVLSKQRDAARNKVLQKGELERRLIRNRNDKFAKDRDDNIAKQKLIEQGQADSLEEFRQLKFTNLGAIGAFGAIGADRDRLEELEEKLEIAKEAQKLQDKAISSGDRQCNKLARDPNNAEAVYLLDSKGESTVKKGNLQGGKRLKDSKKIIKVRKEPIVNINEDTRETEISIKIIREEATKAIDIIAIPYDPADGRVGNAGELDAKKIARRKIVREGRLDEVIVTLRCGTMMFRAQCLVRLLGVGFKIGGEYRVTGVIQTFDGELKTELTLKRRRTLEEILNDGLLKGAIVGAAGTVDANSDVDNRSSKDDSTTGFPRTPGFVVNPSGKEEVEKPDKIVDKILINEDSGLVVPR